jgi:hypothetical protein
LNTQKKLAAIATVIGVAAIGLALPAAAHSAGETKSHHREAGQRSDRNHATLSASITGIPSTVTSARDAHRGAYFTVFELATTAISVPATMPTTGGKRVGIHPTDRSATITGGTLTGELRLHASSATGTKKLAFYPSDGSAAVLVTVVTDSAGNATATASRSLSVSYDAAVAAAAPAKVEGRGEGDHRGHRGKGPRH